MSSASRSLMTFLVFIWAACRFLRVGASMHQPGFENPHVLSEASVWFLDLLMAVGLVILVGVQASALGIYRS